MKAKGFSLVELLMCLALAAVLSAPVLWHVRPGGPDVQSEARALARWVLRRYGVAEIKGRPAVFTFYPPQKAWPLGKLIVVGQGGSDGAFVPRSVELFAQGRRWIYQPKVQTLTPAARFILSVGDKRAQVVLSGRGAVTVVP